MERLDRHWIELLQETRVMQTGVALLTGFLLTLPFQPRFQRLPDLEKGLYLATVATASGSMTALIAPVAMHRLLFRHGARPRLVEQAQRMTLLGLTLLALAIAGMLALIFDLVLGRAWGVTTGVIALAILVALWLVLPLVIRRGLGPPRAAGTAPLQDPPSPETGGSGERAPSPGRQG